MRPTQRLAILSAFGCSLALASASQEGAAQETDSERPLPPAFEMPWQDVAPAVHGDRIVAAAVGEGDPRLGHLSARRAASRRAGEAAARAALHRWADDALAAIHAAPRVATRTHRAIDEHARVDRIRPLSDGSAVVQVTLEVSALRDAAPMPRLPWSAARRGTR